VSKGTFRLEGIGKMAEEERACDTEGLCYLRVIRRPAAWCGNSGKTRPRDLLSRKRAWDCKENRKETSKKKRGHA